MRLEKKALSLLEIIVSLILLSLIMLGVTNLFITGKSWILHARSRMAGGELGRHFLEPLQMQVRQDAWGSNCLTRDGTNPAGCVTDSWIDPASKIEYKPSYEISSVTGTNLRKVRFAVKWTENLPRQ